MNVIKIGIRGERRRDHGIESMRGGGTEIVPRMRGTSGGGEADQTLTPDADDLYNRSSDR